MNIIQRAKNILVAPNSTWPEVAGEEASIGSIYSGYVAPLAAIPAVCGFIGMSLFGVGGMGITFRVPIAAGLVTAVVSYVLSLVMVFVIALIVDALAPTFGGQRNRLNAVKLIAFGSTAGMLGGVFSLVPSLAAVGMIAGLYSIYLVYLGIPVLMKSPKEKSLAYTAVVLVCGIVAAVVLGLASSLLTPGAGMLGSAMPTLPAAPGAPANPTMPNAGAKIDTPAGSITVVPQGDGGQVTISTPQGKVTFDSKNMEEWSQKVEAVNERLEKAQKAGDQAAVGRAMQELGALMSANPMNAAVPGAEPAKK